MKTILGNIACLAMAIFTAQYSAQAQTQWDGISKKNTDDIVTLRTGKAPDDILLNGESATIFAQDPTTIRILIPADKSGISCVNTYIVKYKGEKAGQLIANHCHGDTVFDVLPGEISQSLVSKDDADTPEGTGTDNILPEAKPVQGNENSETEDEEQQNGNRRPSMVVKPIVWNNNQFNTLDSALTWQAGGERDPFLLLAIPETDAFFWIGGCKNGRITNYIQSVNGEEEIGSKTPIFFGTDKQSPMRYSASIAPLPFGEGNDPTVLLSLAMNDPLFGHMASDNWLYVIKGLGENQIRTRISLSGSAKAIRAFQQGCAAQISQNSPAN